MQLDRDARLAIIAEKFKLVGEEVIRISTGRSAMNDKPNNNGYRRLYVLHGGKQVTVLLHRAKFALAHGWLPDVVDHADGDKLNNDLCNLRAATSFHNNWNAKRRKDANSRLPKGVSVVGGKFKAEAQHQYARHYLGVFDTAEEAGRQYEAFCASARGDFHRSASQ